MARERCKRLGSRTKLIQAETLCVLALRSASRVGKSAQGIVLKRTKQLAPHIHDLRRLSEMAKLNLTEQQRNDFDIISTFNVRARYDDAKRTFHQKATHAYAIPYLKTCEEIYQWLLQELRSKK